MKKKLDFKKGFVHTVTIFFLILTFASWGIADYVRGAGGDDVLAQVGKMKITTQSFEQQLERFRAYARQERPETSDEELNSPTLIREQLYQMVRDALIAQYTQNHWLYPSPDLVAKTIATQPEFAENGKFSSEKYFNFIRQTGQKVEGFEQGVKLSLGRDQLLERYLKAAILTPESTRVFLQSAIQSRTVFPHRINAVGWEQTINISDESAQKYYEAHRADFDLPARVQAEYVEFSPYTLASGIEQPTEEELRGFFDTLKSSSQLLTDERRDVRHILIRFGNDKAVALKKLDELAQKAREKPSRFAELARSYSEDPGSKANGGLITNVVRGQMVEAFDRVLFQLNVGEISQVVETPFGYHLLQVEKITPSSQRSFEEMRTDIERRWRDQQAEKKYSALAEEFTETITDLKNAQEGMNELAKKYNLPVGHSPWLSEKTLVEKELPPFNAPAVLKEVLASENIKEPKITLVNIRKERRLIALRVTQSEPRTPQSFEQAKNAVIDTMKREEVHKKIVAVAAEKLSQLQEGRLKEQDILWERPINLNRMIHRDQPKLLEAAFSLPSEPLPHYFTLVDNDHQITLYRLARIFNDAELEKNITTQVRDSYDRYWNQMVHQFVMQAMLQEISVSINEEALAKLTQTNTR